MIRTDLSIDLATPIDALAIAELSRDLIETGLGWSWTPLRVAREIRDPDSIVLVARNRGLMVGFAIAGFGDEIAHLSLLAVRREWQRRGAGRTLFTWLKESALTAGIATMRLELRSANRDARLFYRALGFEDAGLAPGYYRGREAALRMELHFRQTEIGFKP
jgi:ribosomal protein S18 acetylase RimI-like enzyme